ncbi:phospholipid/cholesterol/gamma-HCH transport system permease protein [Loktanella fryxellensis]|uniref:Phospholipid/cholesterol/gamma-HCH transport system permease protein n=1 Tax=Loktanella fryxellensis TaxID=245187 RepID=A0A1H8HK16_9RHOB|nr:ABC transporter permease [Loktanella fryxellensis]SEN55848.1 phospholipid/cholesterol/gamma-HCH transport system permease protein [Loktanella fryxellensis]
MTGPALLSAAPAAAHLTATGDRLCLTGALTIEAVARLVRSDATAPAPAAAVIDVAALTAMDTAGAWWIVTLQDRHAGATIASATVEQTQLIATVRRTMTATDPVPPVPHDIAAWLAGIGKRVVAGVRTAGAIVSFLGQVVATCAGLCLHPRRLRLTALVHHCDQVGMRAVPIVALMAFLIGVVLAFQGSAQLRQFGAEVFVVDLIAISVLRELGILLTAIIVAGRSGSAFTAAIGAMKMREEIDAMRTLGLDPVAVLVVPRVLALMLMLPALGFIADLSGLLGGALMAWIDLGVSPAVFQSRLLSNTDVWHFAVGMIKAPVFALIIGIIGCHMGLTVGGDAESLGQHTSGSVVLSIFLVIVMDALFSIFFATVGV